MQAESRFSGRFNAAGSDGAGNMVCVKITIIPLHRKNTCEQDTQTSIWENALTLNVYLWHRQTKAETIASVQ